MNNAAKLIIGIVGGFFALVLALLLVLILAGGGVFGMGQMMNGYGSGPGQMMNGFGSWWMIVPLLFVWGGVITLVVWAITKIFSNDQSGSDDLPQDKADLVKPTRREFLALTGMSAGALALSGCGILPTSQEKCRRVAG